MQEAYKYIILKEYGYIEKKIKMNGKDLFIHILTLDVRWLQFTIACVIPKTNYLIKKTSCVGFNNIIITIFKSTTAKCSARVIVWFVS